MRGIMGRRLQTIYEFLSDYQESDINAAINELGEEEQEIIIMRYGDDLHKNGWFITKVVSVFGFTSVNLQLLSMEFHFVKSRLPSNGRRQKNNAAPS